MIKIFDAFCSNGSTWFDKEFFQSPYVVKNDIRHGEFLIGNRQKIVIKPDVNFDMFKLQHKFSPEAAPDIIYLDPPHTTKTTGIINEKYSHLPKNWEKAINNMWQNVYKLSTSHTTIILKWNEIGGIDIKSIIRLAKANNIYPLFGSRTRTLSYWIVFRNRSIFY